MTNQNFYKYFTFYFILFGVVISFFGAFTSYMFEMSDIQKRIDRKAVEISEIKINTILKPAIKNMDNIVQTLANNEAILNFIDTNNPQKKKEIEQILLAIASSNTQIMEARLISKDGNELIRINRAKECEKSFVVLKNELQNKSDRYYFQEVSQFKTQTVWHSKIDLIIEHGQVELPYKSTIRAAVPLFKNGNFAGMVIVNILTNDLFAALGASSAFEHFIIDKDKNYILHPDNQFSSNKYTGIKRDLKEDFPDGFDAKGIYTYPIENILNNGDNALFVLKTKENYADALIDEKINTAIIILILTIILSFTIAIYISKRPAKMQKALMKAYEKLNQFSQIIDKYVITATTKPDSTIISVSSAFEQSSGYTKEELIDHKMHIISHPLQDKSLFEDLWETILSGKTWIGEIKNRKKNGETYWLNQHIIPTINENNTIESFVSIGIDITANKELEQLASIDMMTGLYNRRMIDEFLKNELEAVKRHSYELSMIMIDIDYFKSVNDTYGHQIGDSVLYQVAKLIIENTRKSDIQGRYGGEEFIVICPQTSVESAFIVAEKLRIAVDEFIFDIVGHKTISLGISTFEENDDVETMIKKADDALYQAKNSGRNQSVMFNLA